MSSEHLSEDLRCHSEVSVVVEVLEEAFGIKSVFPNNLLELHDDISNDLQFFFSWLSPTVVCECSSIVQNHIHILLKFFLRKDLVD